MIDPIQRKEMPASEAPVLRKSAPDLEVQWVVTGVVTGLATTVVYPLLIFVPMPDLLTVTLASLWGPLLALASLGLYHFFKLHRDSVAAQCGAVSNVVATGLLCGMLLVQMAATSGPAASRPTGLVMVWLGLDVAWDVFISLGTLAFALAAWRHPRLRAAFALPGVAAALVLLGLNLYTFPTPPGEAGLFDAGPLVALWYLVVTLRVWQSLGWARQAAARL